MIVRVTQIVVTEIDVPGDCNESAITMVKGHIGQIIDQQYEEPTFEVIREDTDNG